MAVRAGHRCAGYVPGDGSRGVPCGYCVDGNRRWQKRSSCRRVEVRGWPIRLGDAVHTGLVVMGARRGPSGAAKNGRPQKPSTLLWAPAWRWTGASGTLPLHFRILHPKAPEVMKAPPRACYNFVTLVQGYDKRDGPWTRALVDRAHRETTNVVWAARRACRAAVLHSLSRRAPPAHGSAAP